jgi:hypothetical protein
LLELDFDAGEQRTVGVAEGADAFVLEVAPVTALSAIIAAEAPLSSSSRESLSSQIETPAS